MPAVSAGIFGFPKDRCAHVMVEEIAVFAGSPGGIEGIDIFLMDEQIVGFFSREIERRKKSS
jgi:O-acetyl-ADP-ribose deacetylase (regulator of RNase III)